MNYIVRLATSAERDLKHLPNDVLRRVDAKLRLLERNPRPPGVVKLHGAEETGSTIACGAFGR